MKKQIYSKPEISVIAVEPATVLALSDGGSLGVYDDSASQMSEEKNRNWGELWNN
ncbi:MAG: hypothetical protein J6S03_00960 [Bacteroidaceae bacterium]|nr:hypothetical protein [Bacteroidaceae bacterium]